MIQNFSDDIDDEEYIGGYGDEEITREIIRNKQHRIGNSEG
jgi:hypothetical protein